MPAAGAEAEDEDEESRLQAGLASRILSGPGLWLDWLEEIDRRGLVEELLAEGIIDQAVATAPHGHQLDRALNAKTALLRPGRVPVPRRGLRDLTHHLRHARPGPQARHLVPTGPALSKARALPGEQVAQRASPRRPAVTTTGRTPSPVSWPARCGRHARCRRTGAFSMDRWIRFSATGAHLCWRVKDARANPCRSNAQDPG